MLFLPEKMVQCSSPDIWQYKKPHWSKLFFTAEHVYTRILPSWSYCCFSVKQKPYPFSHCCSEILRDESKENLWLESLLFPTLAGGTWADFSLRDPPSTSYIATHFLIFRFLLVCTWVNRLTDLRDNFLMESDSFLQIRQVESASRLPEPSKGTEYSQVS